MLRLVNLLRRRRNGRSNLDRTLADYTSPNVKRKWGDLLNLSKAEKAEITSGAWRTAPTVQLIADTADRDRGGFVEPVLFASEEAAAAFLQEEDHDDAAEQSVPTLQLAQQFFQDLSRTADEEIDVESGAALAPPTSDAARREEEHTINRQFFADYYTQQGLVAEAAQDAFVRDMMRPAVSLFQINGGLPLVRLVLRHQLEKHVSRGGASSVLRPTTDPRCYQVEMMPSGFFGEPERPPYTEATSPLARSDGTGASTPFLVGEGVQQQQDMALTDDAADLLSRMLEDDASHLASITEDLPEVPAGTSPPPPSSASPPTVGHMHWLQRQVAADTLCSIDILSPILSTVAFHLLRGPASTGMPRIFLDTLGAQQRLNYHWEIAQRLQAAVEDTVAAAVVVVLPLASSSSSGDSLVNGSRVEPPPISERTAETLYVRPDSASVAARLCPPLVGSCSVVLCTPFCSDDGLKPRTALGDNTFSDEDGIAVTPNNFVSVCSKVNAHFTAAVQQLTQALQYARQDGSGWVLYATHSMNPVENEAVVCAALMAWRQFRPVSIVRCVPLTSLCSELPSEEHEALLTWLQYGGPGLATWQALEDGSTAQEVTNCDAAVVASVASASWRTHPRRSGFEGCYVILLHVEGQTELPHGVAAACPLQTEEAALQERGAPQRELHHHGKGTLVLQTPAVAEVIRRLEGSRWSVPYAGVPVGSGESLLLSSAISGREAALHLSQLDVVRSQCPTVRVSTAVLCELLRLRRLSSEGLQQRMRRRSQHRGQAAAATFEDLEITRFLSTMEGVLNETETSTAPRSILRQRTIFIIPELPTVMDGEAAVLHEAVTEELLAVRVIATLTPSCREASTHFSLSLDCPMDMQEAMLHELATAERAVALRDALLYVHHCIGYAGAELRLDVVAPVAIAAEHCGIRVPGDGVVDLRDDEYEMSRPSCKPTDPEAFLSHGERHRHGRRQRHRTRTLAAAGILADGATSNDWVRTLSYGRRRRGAPQT